MLEPESGPAGACGQCPRPAGSPPGPPHPQAGCGRGLTPAAPNLLPDSSEHPFPQLRAGRLGKTGCQAAASSSRAPASGATRHNGLAGHRGHGVDPGRAPLSRCDRGPAAYPPRPPFPRGSHGESFGCGAEPRRGRLEPQCRGPGRQPHASAPPPGAAPGDAPSPPLPLPRRPPGQPGRDQCPSWTTGPGRPSPQSPSPLRDVWQDA